MNTKYTANQSRFFSAGLAALSVAGILAAGLMTATPAQADPPRQAPAYGRRDRDDRRDDRHDRKDDRRDDRRDRKDDRRDDRRDDRHDDNNRSRWDNNRYGNNNQNDRFRNIDRDHDGTPDRYDRYPNDRRRK